MVRGTGPLADFARGLREIAAAAGYTGYGSQARLARDLCKHLGHTDEKAEARMQANVSRWLGGEYAPEGHHIAAFAEVCGVNVDSLMARYTTAGEKDRILAKWQDANEARAEARGNLATRIHATGTKIGEHTVELLENGSLRVNGAVIVPPPTEGTE